LRITDWIHPKLQLRLIWGPALRTRFDRGLLGLYRQVLELLQVKTKSAKIAEGEGLSTICEAV
jgi:hypothetical protein